MAMHEGNQSPSARTSTGFALSELCASDYPSTGTTSGADTEEEMAHHHELTLEEDEERDHVDEIASLHPTTYYSRTSAAYRFGSSIPGDLKTVASDVPSSNRSLWALDLDYREIHGRRYCREYYMPNDEIEQLRLTLMHQVLLHALDNELTLADMQHPTHVLDVGTGTGAWAIRFAEMFPDCEVVGTDISAIAETRAVPVNVFFEIEDAEDWDRPPDHYDLIHMRSMSGAFRDWAYIYRKAYDSVKPGGWIEVRDFTGSFEAFFKIMPADSQLNALFRDVDAAAEKAGRPRGVAHLEPAMLMDAGFVDVACTEYVFPIGVSEKSVGKLWLMVCIDAIEAACLRLLTENMGWDPDQCKAACEAAALELATIARDPVAASGVSMRVRALVGRKPKASPRAPASWTPAKTSAGEDAMSSSYNCEG